MDQLERRQLEHEGTEMQVKKYSDLIVWQKAMDLAIAIYRYTERFPGEERYGLTAQLRGEGVSVPSNIAEGHGQITTKNSELLICNDVLVGLRNVLLVGEKGLATFQGRLIFIL